MRKTILLLTAGLLLLSGCSQQTEKPQQGATPPPASQDGKGQGQAGEAAPPEQQQAEKTDEQVQAEIKTKLSRMTAPSGYSLQADSTGLVAGAKTVDDVAELLRKKGFSPDLAKALAANFYKADATGVTLIAKDGAAGVFKPDQDATFTKKSKYVWQVVQQHPDDQMNGPNTATYEVEVLKDGTYRLNQWKIQMSS